MTNSEMKALSEIGEVAQINDDGRPAELTPAELRAALRSPEFFRTALVEPQRLIHEAQLVLSLISEPAHVSAIGRTLWRLLDAAGQLAEICPREIYDPTKPTGMGFSLRIHGTIGSEVLDEIEAEGVVDELRRLVAPLRTFMRFYAKISPIAACEAEVEQIEAILSELPANLDSEFDEPDLLPDPQLGGEF